MVPLAHKKEILQQLATGIQKLDGDTTTLFNRKAFHTLIDQAIACNEIAGLGFIREAGKICCVPLPVEGYGDTKYLRGIFGNWCTSYEYCTTRIKFHHRSYWTHDHLLALHAAESMTDPMEIIRIAVDVAKDVLKRSPLDLAVVCGPISTGIRSVEENLEIFNRSIFIVSMKSDVFNQMPFERAFHAVHTLVQNDRILCPSRISTHFFMEHFYEHVFGYPKQWWPNFIDGWTHSVGANMEHARFSSEKRSIKYLDPDFHRKLF